MPKIRSETLIRRVIDEAFNEGNLDVVDELLIQSNFPLTAATGAMHDAGNLKRQIAILRAAFPDLHCSVDDEIDVGDRQMARWTLRGTHGGSYLGSRPTGKKIEVQGIILATFAEGKITSYWLLTDQYGLLQQLGIIPG